MSVPESPADGGEWDRKFTEMVRTHQTMIYRYARYLVHDAALAEELAQDTFVTAYSKLRRESPEGEMGAWLRGVVRNLVLRARTKRKVQVLFTDEEGLEVAERVWARQELPENASADPRLEALRRCVGALSADDKQLLKLRFEEQRSREQLSELLRLSAEGIKTRLRRLRAKLLDCAKRRLAGKESSA